MNHMLCYEVKLILVNSIGSCHKKLTLAMICRFIVMPNRVKKYKSRIGQKTGMLNTSKNVRKKAIKVALLTESLKVNLRILSLIVSCKNDCRACSAYQNLNSGSLRMNGRNSSLALVGKVGPSSAVGGQEVKRMRQTFRTKGLT